MFYKVVGEEFGENLRQSLLRGDSVEHLMHFPDLLEVYWAADVDSDRPNVIAKEQIIWTIAKLIATLSSRLVYGKMGSLVQDCIIRLAELLDLPTRLSILQHGTFDKTISDFDEVLVALWLTVLKLITSAETHVKNKAILIAQRLLSMDLCNALFADLLIDVFVAVERWLYGLSAAYVGEDELCLREALETCERTFGDALRKYFSIFFF
ncbi:unnamed protein product [Gongylonema pulchrum]|uniref:PI3K/PI4K domain-containing protein n=1 Tax=Gongylonema pulchrum TaxID=637853 RepID=A0A183EF96_9BILA|nr:unnamed protein product [Gongylonema pulchrum]